MLHGAYSSTRTASGEAIAFSAASSPSTASAHASTAWARGDLEHGRRPVRVGEREVHRLLVRAAVELDADELGGVRAGRRGVGRRELDDRLVRQARVIRPRRRDDLGIQVMRSLLPLLDRGQAPGIAVARHRPVLAHVDHAI